MDDQDDVFRKTAWMTQLDSGVGKGLMGEDAHEEFKKK